MPFFPTKDDAASENYESSHDSLRHYGDKDITSAPGSVTVYPPLVLDPHNNHNISLVSVTVTLDDIPERNDSQDQDHLVSLTYLVSW